ncbi:MAG: N-acetylmuramoyl-L-alanine amidase [Bacillota bacterium]|nr:N-acetylmuramoyl-L-alanine amidase [Bacillota bacterium]
MEFVKKFILTVITSVTIALCTPFITQASPLVYPTERIAGQDRVDTALKISQKGWNSAQTVILCEYSDFPDSIAATPFAVNLNAPILLTKGDSIDSRVLQELQRLKPQKVILLGGTACLQPSIEEELNQLSLTTERIGGIDRYETSILLAQKLSSDSLIIANGDDFPDALSAATFAGIKQIPIALTSTTLPQSVLQYIKEKAPQHTIVIGGEVVVPSKEFADNKISIETRLGGYDRYETNAKVTSYVKETFPDTYQSDDLFLASGITFPDAIAGTVLASKSKAPLLLTEQTDIPPSVYALMRGHMKVEPPTNSNDDSEKIKVGKIAAVTGLNLRDIPSTSGKLLLTIPKGTTINLVEQQNNWYKTTYQSLTGWVSADYVTIASTSTPNTDISVNGNVYILGGTGIISSKAQTIIEGKASSSYNANLQDFPPLPSSLEKPAPPSRGDDVITPPPADNPPTDNPPVDTPPVQTYDPSTDVLQDPFAGIPASALAGKTIMIDPGHGGPDVGAVGPNHSYEKTNNLAIALALNTILQQAGAGVILTRSDDSSPSANYTEEEDLEARVALANKYNPDLFICIHNDSFSNPDVQGTSTYYSQNNPKELESQQLAKSIQSAVTGAVNTNNRGIKEAGFYVLRKTTMPAILLETAFISSPYEEARLQNPTFQKNVAGAIFRGIYNYYKLPNPINTP